MIQLFFPATAVAVSAAVAAAIDLIAAAAAIAAAATASVLRRQGKQNKQLIYDGFCFVRSFSGCVTTGAAATTAQNFTVGVCICVRMMYT